MADPTMTKEQQEKKVADFISRMTDFLDGDYSPEKLRDQIKALKANVDDLKSIDVKAAIVEVEKLKATQELIAKQIKTNRNGFYVPGLESVKFSLSKALIASKIGWKEADAENERDVLKEVWKEHGEKILSMKGQSIGDDNVGGNFVPDQVIAEPIAAIYRKSAFVNIVGEGTQRVSVLDGLTGAPVRWPRWKNGLVAYTVDEEEEVTKSNSKTELVTFTPKKVMVAVDVTREMKDFGGFGWDRMLMRDFVRTVAAKIDYLVAYGKGGDAQPRGIINTNGIKIYSAEKKNYGVLGMDALGGAKFQADWGGAELDFDGLDNMLLALEEDDITLDDSQAFISSPRFWRRLKQIKVENYATQTTGQPYLLGMPIISKAKLREAIGEFDDTPMIPSTNKPGASIGAPTSSANEKYTDVFGGNLAAYVLARWGGIELEDDGGKGSGFLKDVTQFKLRVYVDGNASQPRMLIVCPDAKARS